MTSITVGSEDWKSVIYADNKFVAVGLKGQIGYSSDGIDWNETSAPEANSWLQNYGDGKFIAVSFNGTNV